MKNPDEEKPRPRSITATDTEWNQITEAAIKKRMSTTQYVLWKCLGERKEENDNTTKKESHGPRT